MATVPSVTAHAKGLAEGDIEAVNLLPAYRASLVFIDEGSVERAVGWRREELERVGAVVSGASTYSHLELLYDRADYGAFVDAAVRAHDARSLGVVGLACKTLPTVAAALACHARYQHLTNRSARYVHHVDDGVLAIHQRRHGPPSRGRDLMTTFTFLVALELLAVVSNVRPRALALRVPHRLHPHERDIVASRLGAPIVEGADDASLDVDAAILGRPAVSADPDLQEHFLSLLEQAAAAVDDVDPWVAAVRRAVEAALVRGEPALLDVARACGMGGRTLQRRLAAAHTTFAVVVDEVRQRQAQRYLADDQRSLSEVAFLLGYAEHSSFFRAFKRWFNTTPQQWRQQLGAR